MSTYYRRDEWVTDALGNAISGADVYVYVNNTTSPQQLYADSAGVTPLAQPVITDGYGHAAYYVAPGTYTVVYSSPQITTVTLPDQTIAAGAITFPITIAEGGTNATTAAQAKINLAAAASGANADITSLSAITGTIAVAAIGQVVCGTGGGATVLNSDGLAASEATLGALLVSGEITASALTNGTPGDPITVGQSGGGEVALEIIGTGVASQCLLGFATYPTQTTVGVGGGASNIPTAPTGYLQVKVNGTIYCIPYFPLS